LLEIEQQVALQRRIRVGRISAMNQDNNDRCIRPVVDLAPSRWGVSFELRSGLVFRDGYLFSAAGSPPLDFDYLYPLLYLFLFLICRSCASFDLAIIGSARQDGSIFVLVLSDPCNGLSAA
jgi:hypothetical protein